MLVLAVPSHKMGGRFRVLRDRRNTIRSVSMQAHNFLWQAQHFVMWPFEMAWLAQHFVTWRKYFFHESACHGCANMTQCQKSWQAQHLVSVLKSGGSCAKVILVELCKNSFKRKTRMKPSIFKLKVWNFWRKSRTKCSFWLFKLSRWDVIFAFCVAGARFWKLLAWKVKEISHEMLVLKASCLKSWGSLAQNARFRRFLPEQLRKPRTCSFWKLFAWKLKKPRTTCSFWKLF